MAVRIQIAGQTASSLYIHCCGPCAGCGAQEVGSSFFFFFLPRKLPGAGDKRRPMSRPLYVRYFYILTGVIRPEDYLLIIPRLHRFRVERNSRLFAAFHLTLYRRVDRAATKSCAPRKRISYHQVDYHFRTSATLSTIHINCEGETGRGALW